MGRVIEFEGAQVEIEEETVYMTGIEPGETYMAWSNSNDRWHMLTCKFVDRGGNRCDDANEKTFCHHHPEEGHISCIFPAENAYAFNSWMCHKVREIR